MTLGHLYTRKSWAESLGSLKEELLKWGIEDYVLPTLKECRASGSVAIGIARRGIWIYPRCTRFPTPEQNIRAIVLAVEGMRKAEQRGIGELFSELAKLLALPDGKHNAYEVLGVKQGEEDSIKLKAAYREKVKVMHPDHGGTVEGFKGLQEAAKALGIV